MPHLNDSSTDFEKVVIFNQVNDTTGSIVCAFRSKSGPILYNSFDVIPMW